MSTPPTPAALFSNEALKTCILSKAECEAFKKNATFVGVYSHEDGRILVDSENDLRTQLTEIHKVLSDLWAHVVDMGWMDADCDSQGAQEIRAALEKFSPPTVHDSDRKAAEEIKRKWSVQSHHYEGYVVAEDEELALIIARHHAEERAAVEKVREALESIQKTLFRANVPSSHRPKGYSAFSQKKQVEIALETATAALAALRTASQ